MAFENETLTAARVPSGVSRRFARFCAPCGGGSSLVFPGCYLCVVAFRAQSPDFSTLAWEYPMSTKTGTVKWFNETKGFGFIAPDDGSEDLFAHFSEIQGQGFKTLAEKQRVQFEVTQGKKGLQASRIQVI
jgi:CspA family cold shock protein